VKQDFPKNQFARHSAKLLGAAEGPPKHYHAAQGVHAYVFVCLQALWRIYVRFIDDIDIKILGGGVSPTLLFTSAVCVCILEVAWIGTS